MGQSLRGNCPDAGAAMWEVITTRGQVHLLDDVDLGLGNIITRFEQTDGSMPCKLSRYESHPHSGRPLPGRTGRQDTE